MKEFLRPVEPHEDLGGAQIYGLEEYENWDSERLSPEGRIKKALEIGKQYGQINGEDHKTWVIDQMIRALTGSPVAIFRNFSAHPTPILVAGLGESDEYKQFVSEHNKGEDGPNTYSWSKGIAP